MEEIKLTMEPVETTPAAPSLTLAEEEKKPEMEAVMMEQAAL